MVIRPRAVLVITAIAVAVYFVLCHYSPGAPSRSSINEYRFRQPLASITNDAMIVYAEAADRRAGASVNRTLAFSVVTPRIPRRSNFTRPSLRAS